jgi:hypothetical protein
MNSVDPSCRECTLDSLLFAEVSDLVASSVVGGALAVATANASAYGNPSLALTNTKTTAIQFANGGSIAMGWGSAVASGNNPAANVSVSGTGNNAVLAYNTTTNFSTATNSSQHNVAMSTGFIVAVDFPT